MADEYSNALGRLDYLDYEVAKARKLGLLGETGPGVENGRKDEQAEKIENIIAVAKGVLSRSKTEDESNSESSYAWYSIRGILGVVFAPKKTDLTKHFDAHVSSALNIARTTAQFRKRYEFIYRAAFYAILPMRTVTKEVPPMGREIKAKCLMSASGICLGTFQTNGLAHFSSRLDSDHLLDQSLISLSSRVATILEVTWKQVWHHIGNRMLFLQSDAQHQVVDALAKEIIERAGYLFQDILVKSQSDSIRRATVSLLLEDISRMIEILETYVNEGKSNDMSFITSLDRRWREEYANGWKYSVPQRQTQDSVLGLITRTRYWKTDIAQGNALDTLRARDTLFLKAGNSWRFNEVAVKVLRSTGPEHAISLRALREFIIWSQMKHPNIVPLIGLWFDFGCVTGLPAFVSPWIEHGSLLKYLSDRPNMDRPERLHLLLGVAKALAYMHNHQLCVSHGDINPENILVSNGNAFVCDFGISHISEPYRGLTTDPHGNWRYRAPEQLLGRSTPTPQSDMYSFGLLCYNVLTCLEPWHDISEADRLNNPNVMMSCPDSMLADDYELLVYCWMIDPRLRATASIAVSSLNELVE
ncbi:hypothetical protein ACEPAH_4061 [Sanghuangporus vaninii]